MMAWVLRCFERMPRKTLFHGEWRRPNMVEKEMHDPRGGAVRLRGIMVAADWDETGRVTVAALSTFDEQVYQLDTGMLGDQLDVFLRKEVELFGEFVGEGDNRVFAVKSCFRNADLLEVE